MRNDLNKIASGDFGSGWIDAMVKMTESVEIRRSKFASPDGSGTTLEGYNYSENNKAVVNDGGLPNPESTDRKWP